VPNETRQPFADGSTDFERILPGPDRMYPDTDSPPTRVTRERVERLRGGLGETPWERERRYRAVGVPVATIHYLIRRGGADLVDGAVAESGADLRWTCFFFGERVKALRRSGVEVDRIALPRWQELFRAFAARPVLKEAWEPIVRAMVAAPESSVESLVAARWLGLPPPAWREELPQVVLSARAAAHSLDAGSLLRLCLGVVMPSLRGRVGVADVARALAERIGSGS
jgi:glutamyl-tRNA(Gln) amidotransferase subunit E